MIGLHRARPVAIDPTQLRPGQRVSTTSWVVVDKLGQGGMAVVLKVTKPPGIVMAMKAILPHLASRPESSTSFLREVQLQASLKHRNIVQVTDFERLPDGLTYAIMECITGSTLRQAMRSLGQPIQPKQVLEITRQISDGLERAHSQGVVHRDGAVDRALRASLRGRRVRGHGDDLVTLAGLAPPRREQEPREADKTDFGMAALTIDGRSLEPAVRAPAITQKLSVMQMPAQQPVVNVAASVGATLPQPTDPRVFPQQQPTPAARLVASPAPRPPLVVAGPRNPP